MVRETINEVVEEFCYSEKDNERGGEGTLYGEGWCNMGSKGVKL